MSFGQWNFREEYKATVLNRDAVRTFSSFKDLPVDLLNLIEANTNQVICVLNSSGKLVFVSQSVYMLLGYEVENLYEMGWRSFVNEPTIKSLKEGIKDLSIKTKYRSNVALKDHQSQMKWFDCTVQKLNAKQEDDYFYVVFLESIDQQRDMDELLAQSEKLSVAGQLAAGIVHEIRNPLTALKGFVQLMEAGIEGKQEYYNIMIEEIEKMEAMATELLYISRPPSDFKKNESVANMIDDVLVLLGTQAKQRKINLVWEEKDDITIYCNRSQIKQVLINLIKNAIEAVTDSGEIRIETQKDHRQVSIDVIDNGPGVPENIIHKLGQPFFTTKEQGTGLGLMVSKQLLEQHTGKLEIFRNHGKGSTFRIVLPHQMPL